MPNKLSQFWQELKRRKIIRTVTVYAAAAFVILELVDIIAPNLGLPEWTFNLVLILLLVGFIIAVIVSWIYDIHPEEGVVKTEPVEKMKIENIPKSFDRWKIASYISMIVIVGLIILNIIPRTGKKEILDKSIAVLPFRNDSPDQERMYFINGTMEAILDNLCKIKDMRVPGRTSVEQYRDNPKPIPVVAEEMDVSYVLEGSGHRDGNNVRLFVQLLDGKKDKHLWSRSYDTDIEEIFSMQSEIAQLVAAEIEAIITDEEKALIEKAPTTSLTAYDFYLRGNEELSDFDVGSLIYYGIMQFPEESLKRAEHYYRQALEYDNAFSLAYVGLAKIHWERDYWKSYWTEDFLDSVIILTDRALSYNDENDEAYLLRGKYYREMGQSIKAIEAYDRALELNPNSWEAYFYKGFAQWGNDGVEAIKNYHEAVSLNRGGELPELLRTLGTLYFGTGFREKARYFREEAFKIDRDSFSYFDGLSTLEYYGGDMGKSIEFGELAYEMDSTNSQVLMRMGQKYQRIGNHERSLKYYRKWIERIGSDEITKTNQMHRVGYAFWMNGYKEDAEHYFDLQLDYSQENIELNRSEAENKSAYYDLAAVYAFRGEKEKALENLRIFNQRRIVSYYMKQIAISDPLFDNIKDDPEYQQILRDIEAKYQAEHTRVKQWLEENEMF